MTLAVVLKGTKTRSATTCLKTKIITPHLRDLLGTSLCTYIMQKILKDSFSLGEVTCMVQNLRLVEYFILFCTVAM